MKVGITPPRCPRAPLQVLLALPVDLAALKAAKIGPPIAKLRAVQVDAARTALGDAFAAEAASVAAQIYAKWADAAKAKPPAPAPAPTSKPTTAAGATGSSARAGGKAPEAHSAEAAGPPVPPPFSSSAAASAASDSHGRDKKKSRRSDGGDGGSSGVGGDSDSSSARHKAKKGEAAALAMRHALGFPACRRGLHLSGSRPFEEVWCLISAGKFPEMYPTPSPSRRLPHPPRLEAVVSTERQVFLLCPGH